MFQKFMYTTMTDLHPIPITKTQINISGASLKGGTPGTQEKQHINHCYGVKDEEDIASSKWSAKQDVDIFEGPEKIAASYFNKLFMIGQEIDRGQMANVYLIPKYCM